MVVDVSWMMMMMSTQTVRLGELRCSVMLVQQVRGVVVVVDVWWRQRGRGPGAVWVVQQVRDVVVVVAVWWRQRGRRPAVPLQGAGGAGGGGGGRGARHGARERRRRRQRRRHVHEGSQQLQLVGRTCHQQQQPLSTEYSLAGRTQRTYTQQ